MALTPERKQNQNYFRETMVGFYDSKAHVFQNFFERIAIFNINGRQCGWLWKKLRNIPDEYGEGQEM
jgi:hypothetical protein